MTDALDPAVPAGWYPDPWGASAQRWWDGLTWTQSLRTDSEPDDASAEPSGEPDFMPTVTRSTFEPRTGQAALPSRRALREQVAEPESTPHAQTLVAAEAAPAAAPPVAEPLPPSTPAPAVMPQFASAFAPPVFTDPAPQAVGPEPASTPVTFTAPSEASAAAPSSPVAPGPADDDWAASLSRWDDVDSTIAPPDAPPIFGDAPPVSYSQRAVRYQPLHGRTSAVWLIVFIPIIHAAAVIGTLYLFPGIVDLTNPTESLSTAPPDLLVLRDWAIFAVAPLAVAFFVFTLVLGFQDRARLRLLGHDDTASPWWILLHTLVYLIVRSVRVRQCTGRRGSGPLTTYLGLYIAPSIALGITAAVVSALDGAIPT